MGRTNRMGTVEETGTEEVGIIGTEKLIAVENGRAFWRGRQRNFKRNDRIGDEDH